MNYDEFRAQLEADVKAGRWTRETFDDIFSVRVLHPDGSVTVQPRPRADIEKWLEWVNP